MIYCLMVTGLPLSNDVLNSLFRAAREMVLKGKSRLPIRGDSFEGRVETKGAHACVGALSGMKFSGVVESNAFTTKVDFIVRTRDLEDLNIEELTWTRLNEPAERASMN